MTIKFSYNPLHRDAYACFAVDISLWCHVQIHFTKERIEAIKELSKRADIYDRLAQAVAPSVYEHDDIKKGILLQVSLNFNYYELFHQLVRSTKIFYQCS